MTRHLQKCGQPRKTKEKAGQSFHLFIQGRYAKAYWMHVAVPVEAPLSKLDQFLRRTWLECCGHLSAFSIYGNRYGSSPVRDLGESGMRMTLNRVLEVGLTFSHEYDYGSTTELTLKVQGLRDCDTPGAIELLARNDPPEVPCDECKSRPATQICTECACDGDGWFCDTCAAAHPCGDEECLPVVNSPRVGVCGYTG
jgi:hypothetical protein